MKSLHRILSFLLLLGVYIDLSALEQPDSIRISIITCSPGPEIFELYGHQAVRVSGRIAGEDIDRIYNYGMFDFASPGFIYRFVKGETDYFAAVMPTPYFIQSYIDRGSAVHEQQLYLSATEATKLFKLLEHDILPENATYRYKYFSNNCATRVIDNLEKAIVEPIDYPVYKETVTRRELLRHYNTGYPWYQLGIDIALGSMIDKPASPRDRMFIPIETEAALTGAHRSTGNHATVATTPIIIYQGNGDMRLPPTAWYLGPMFILTVTAAATCALALYGLRRKRFFVTMYAAWGTIMGLAGCLVWFLTFLSVHEGTSPNFLALWLNPFWLLITATAWKRSWRKLLNYILSTQGAIAALILMCAPWLPQSINAALYPLLVSTVVLCGTAYLILRNQIKKS